MWFSTITNLPCHRVVNICGNVTFIAIASWESLDLPSSTIRTIVFIQKAYRAVCISRVDVSKWTLSPSAALVLWVESSTTALFLFGRSEPSNHIKRTCSCAVLKLSRGRITRARFWKPYWHDIASHEQCSPADTQVESPVGEERTRQTEVNMHDLLDKTQRGSCVLSYLPMAIYWTAKLYSSVSFGTLRKLLRVTSIVSTETRG